MLKTANFCQIPEIENDPDFEENLSTIEKIGFFDQIGLENFIVPNGSARQMGNWQSWDESDEGFRKFNILCFFEIFYFMLISALLVAQFYQTIQTKHISKRVRTNRKMYLMSNFQIFKISSKR